MCIILYTPSVQLFWSWLMGNFAVPDLLELGGCVSYFNFEAVGSWHAQFRNHCFLLLCFVGVSVKFTSNFRIQAISDELSSIQDLDGKYLCFDDVFWMDGARVVLDFGYQVIPGSNSSFLIHLQVSYNRLLDSSFGPDS